MTTHYTMTVEFRDRLIGGLRNDLDKTGDKRAPLRRFRTELAAILLGRSRSMVRACIAEACASGTYTCTQSAAIDATTAATIAGTVMTAKTTPTTTAQFAIGSTDAGMAASLAAAINANATLAKIVRATSLLNVVTVTSLYPGPIGNLITITETSNGLVVSGAALTAGASDEVDSYELGYTPSV